jgi:CRISPR-associated protein Csb3
MDVRFTINRLNPAEYFAALGILELIARQDPSATSYFEGSGNLAEFVIASNWQVPDLRALSVTALPHPIPLIAPVALGDIRLDWWLDVFTDDSSILKMWAGTVTPVGMLTNFQSLMNDEMSLDFKVQTKTKSTFAFDTRASRDPLKTGYSLDAAGERAVLYPCAEFLCAVGLQNFRPALAKQSITYFTWSRPIRTSIAHAACRMEIMGLEARGYEVMFKKISQGQREIKSVVSLQAATMAGTV